MIPTRRTLISALVAAPAFWLSAPAQVGPAAAPLDHDHAAWTGILSAFVDGDLVDYARLKRDGRDRLRAYTRQLEAHAGRLEGWTRAQRLAFWINAYNAYTVQLVVDAYPVTGIRSIGGLFSGSVFARRFIPLGPAGGLLSLDDVEHTILRPVFRDARVHFAIVCASTSCPALRRDAYRATDLDRQLDDAAARFLGDERKNRYDARTNTLWLSRIFDWFGEDFERDAGSVAAYVSRHLPATVAATVQARQPRIRFLDYDWSLNRR